MPEFCAAYGCSNRRCVGLRQRGITFHVFPKDGERRGQWTVALGRENLVVSDRTRICSEHFRAEDFDRTGQTVRLKAGVVPTIFSFPAHLQRPVPTRSTATTRRAEDNLDLSLDEPKFDKLGATRERRKRRKRQATDHTYGLPVCSKAIKAKLDAASARVMQLEREKINAVMREMRAKKNMQALLEELKEKNLINDELNDKLERFSEEEQLLVIKEEVPDSWSSGLNHQNPETLQMKKEEEDLCSRSDGELIDEEEELDDARFPITVVTVKIEDDGEEPQLSELHHIKDEENRETNVPTSSSAEQMQPSPAGVRTGWKEIRGKRYLDEDQQMLEIKEEVPDLWNSSLDQQDPELIEIKKEEEEQWISQDEELCTVNVADEEKPHLSELQQIKPENRESEAPTSSSVEQRETEPHGSFNSLLGKRLNKTNVKLQMRTQTGYEERSSDLCGKGLKEKGSLQAHMRLHAEERTFTCDVCGTRFQRRETLKNHMRIHPTEKQFTCSVCSKAFSRQDHLKSHMRVHTGEKPFSCSFCSKGFSQQIHLKSHMRVHTGEKPFICSFCSKGFSRQDLLKSHMRVHTGEKPFVCSVCSKGFSQHNHLKNHMGFHMTTFNCSDCGKRFVKEEQLKRHVRLHTEGRPFGCDVCKSRFYKRNHLENHMRIHSGEKPFACRVCSKAFSRDGDLKRHMGAHEGSN